MKLDIGSLQTLYRSGQAKPSDVIAEVYDRIARMARGESPQPVWISQMPRETAMAQARDLERDPAAAIRPLYGIPFAMKDNIDLAGLPTTAGCPAYAYSPSHNATVVERLTEAGAIAIGKTNMDQFATGLVGTRSPHGACSSVFDSRYISGGSSSGSAVAVAAQLVSFSLGTDTAGSGRVPAAFNNLIGLKPSRGLLSAAGVVPACRSLDCVSIFTENCSDAHSVWRVAKGFDPSDPYSRMPRTGEGAAASAALSGNGSFRFGVPPGDQLEFFGDQEAARLYQAAVERLVQLNGIKVEIDFSKFRDVAQMLYSGPWVAERYAAIRQFIEAQADAMDPVVRGIILGAGRYSAADAFAAEYKLRELRRVADREWERMDVLVVPSTPTIYTHAEIAADPVGLNTNLGYYTNFVNLLDQAAVAAPAGFRENGLPFGITFIAPAFTDEALLMLADRYCQTATQSGGKGTFGSRANYPAGCIPVAVVGAHLSGQPLNMQLIERGARLIKATKTLPCYRFYALPDTSPLKPGLVREEGFEGPGIEVEVWAVPEDQFGSFVAAVPAPLGIGSAMLVDGETVKCFICEPYALNGAREITHFGGWRSFLASEK